MLYHITGSERLDDVASFRVDLAVFKMGIAHCRPHIGMTEDFLDLIKAHSSLDQSRRMRVPKRVD